jgi:glycosyltransferase involved in cell wall biosynthesis
MKVLVFELSPKGHRLAWVRHLLDGRKRQAGTIVFATSSAVRESPEFSTYIHPVSDRVDVQEVAAGPSSADFGVSLLRQGLVAWRHLRAAVRRHRPDGVIVPTGDGLVHAAGLGLPGRLYRGPPMEAGLVKCTFAYPDRKPASLVKTGLTLASLWNSPFRSVKIINPVALAWLDRHAPRLRPKVSLMPDPVQDPPRMQAAEARRRLGIHEDLRVVGAVGTLNARKGIDRLVQAFLHAAGESDRLLLAGRQSPEIRASLSRLGPEHGRFIVAPDRYLDEESYWLSLHAMDVVAAPYVRHRGSSAMVIAAVKAGKPVLGCMDGWVGYAVRRFSLGWVCDPYDREQFAASLRASMDGAAHHRPSESARRLAAYHSVEGYRAAWLDDMDWHQRSRTDPPPPTWDWVLRSGA